MRKNMKICLTALLATALLFCVAARADTLSDLLSASNLTPVQQAEFRALVEQMKDAPGESDLRSLLEAYRATLDGQPGVVADGRVTLPGGLSCIVPEGWRFASNEGAASLMLLGEAENGVAPCIGILVMESEQADFDTADQAHWDDYYRDLLPGFESGLLDSFSYQDLTAHEYVCRFGKDSDHLLVQYQMYFNREGRAYVITLTASAEETAFMSALNAYDGVIASLSFDAVADAAQANG